MPRHYAPLLLALLLPAAALAETTKVDRKTDISYHDGQGADAKRHLLDLYIPREKKDAPVLLFIHGGGWRHGAKDLYGYLASSFAEQGILTVAINYRLSPAVKHPAHIEDAARAFAWVKRNIARYGGDAENVFVCGHSAGGHLSALLATNEKYLKAHKLAPSDIRGVIPISGVFKVNASRYFDRAFPQETRNDASPVDQVDERQPPFLVIYGDKDMGSLREQARSFAGVLRQKKSPVELLQVERNHFTIIMFAGSSKDPVHQSIVNFIGTHRKKKEEK